jgi:hypothetical protein
LREQVVDRVALDVDVGEEPGGEVALGRRGDDGHDLLALVLRALGELEGGPDGGAGGDADGDAVELVHLLADRGRVVLLHLDDSS